jgi:hypothetical protein
MATFLKWAGALWALLGLADVVVGFSKEVSPTVGAISLMFNGLVFCFPGLVLFALGARMASGKAEKRGVDVRLRDLTKLKENGQITIEEFDSRRSAILQEV